MHYRRNYENQASREPSACVATLINDQVPTHQQTNVPNILQ